MGNITFKMNDVLEEKLRDLIPNRKGALGEALSEGAQIWIDKHSKKFSHVPGKAKKVKRKRMRKN